MLQHFLNNSFENLNYAKLSVASVLFTDRGAGGVRGILWIRPQEGDVPGMKKAIKPGEIFAFILTFISVAPFCYVLVLSFLLASGGVTFSYYYDVFLGSPQYLLRFWKSMGICLCIVAGQLVMSVLAGYGFAKCEFRGRDTLLFVLMIPYGAAPSGHAGSKLYYARQAGPA